MSIAVQYPDAEAVVCGHLDDLFGVPAVTRVPSPRPASFVRVTRAGGVPLSVVWDNPTLACETWAATASEAHDLATMVVAELQAITGAVIDGVTVGRVRVVGGPQNFPDPVSASPRYVFTVQLPLRGTDYTPGS